MQFLSENCLHRCQVFGRFGYFISESNFGCPHTLNISHHAVGYLQHLFLQFELFILNDVMTILVTFALHFSKNIACMFIHKFEYYSECYFPLQL